MQLEYMPAHCLLLSFNWHNYFISRLQFGCIMWKLGGIVSLWFFTKVISQWERTSVAVWLPQGELPWQRPAVLGQLLFPAWLVAIKNVNGSVRRAALWGFRIWSRKALLQSWLAYPPSAQGRWCWGFIVPSLMYKCPKIAAVEWVSVFQCGA